MAMFLTTQLGSSSASSSLCFHSSDLTSHFLQPLTNPKPSSIFCRNSFWTKYSSSSPRVSADQAAGPVSNSPANDALQTPPRSRDLQIGRQQEAIMKRDLFTKEGLKTSMAEVCFHFLLGFLPFPQLSPYHSCKEPNKSIQEIARALTGSLISVKVIQADEANKKLILSEKEAAWVKFSRKISVGDIFDAKVGSIEDYGAFLHLHFPDGCYHLTGLVHVSEVSWDLVQDVRDVLHEGDEVRVKIIKIDRAKSRITLSIKQLEEDPLLETLDKVIPKDGSDSSSEDPLLETLDKVIPKDGSDSSSEDESYDIEPLQGLETIIEVVITSFLYIIVHLVYIFNTKEMFTFKKIQLISDVRISRQGYEKRVVSQDLQLWLSNAPSPSVGEQFTLLARAGRQVQEIQLTTVLDQEGIKKALQRVLERVP